MLALLISNTINKVLRSGSVIGVVMKYKDFLVLATIIIGLSTPPAIAQNEMQDSGGFRVLPDEDGRVHSWQDGDYIISLWEAENLVMERYDAGEQSGQPSAIKAEDVLADNGELRVIKKQSWHRMGDDVFPVLVTENGAWKALPGDVIVVLSPEMKQADIDAFFAEMNLDRVSKMNFTENAYLVETEPGVVGLELSNKLTGMEAVELSSPNWWSLVELR